MYPTFRLSSDPLYMSRRIHLLEGIVVEWTAFSRVIYSSITGACTVPIHLTRAPGTAVGNIKVGDFIRFDAEKATDDWEATVIRAQTSKNGTGNLSATNTVVAEKQEFYCIAKVVRTCVCDNPPCEGDPGYSGILWNDTIGVIKIGRPHYFGLIHGEFVKAKVYYNPYSIGAVKHNLQSPKWEVVDVTSVDSDCDGFPSYNEMDLGMIGSTAKRAKTSDNWEIRTVDGKQRVFELDSTSFSLKNSVNTCRAWDDARDYMDNGPCRVTYALDQINGGIYLFLVTPYKKDGSGPCADHPDF